MEVIQQRINEYKVPNLKNREGGEKRQRKKKPKNEIKRTILLTIASKEKLKTYILKTM